MGKNSDFKQLQEWVETYQPVVYRAARLILRDSSQAEDVAQDAFLRAHGATGRVPPNAEVGPWLCRIAVNLSLNRLRSRKRESAALERLGPQSRQSSSDSSEAEINRSTLSEALKRLPDRIRIPIVLRYYLDYSETQIAKALSIRPGTVKSRLHEARRLLAEDSSVLTLSER